MRPPGHLKEPIFRKIASSARSNFERWRQRRMLAPLYAPDASNLDVPSHITAAMGWLKRAQDAGKDRGVSYGVQFGAGFQESYPETTGYICRTFVEQAEIRGESELMDRAIQMGNWEAEIQLPEGAVMGGKYGRDPTPAVFNTGMVLLGWNALIRRTGDERFKRACQRAADWLVRMQEPDGNWKKGNSRFADAQATIYNVKAAWGLCETGIVLDCDEYVRAAIRNAELCISRQQENGWFRDCCLSDPLHPLLHTLAYTMQGLVGIGKLTGRDEFIDAARKTADALLRAMRNDGFLPGRLDREFRGSVDWCCLTGSAQTSIVWSELYRITAQERYLRAVRLVNRYLMARHDIRNTDLALRGGVAGSWPTWGPYGRLMILNWATKFLTDALSLEQEITAGQAAVFACGEVRN